MVTISGVDRNLKTACTHIKAATAPIPGRDIFMKADTIASRAAIADHIRTSRCPLIILNIIMPFPEHVRAGAFAAASAPIRQRSLRHRALVNATYYRNYPNSGSYASMRRRWRAGILAAAAAAAAAAAPAALH